MQSYNSAVSTVGHLYIRVLINRTELLKSGLRMWRLPNTAAFSGSRILHVRIFCSTINILNYILRPCAPLDNGIMTFKRYSCDVAVFHLIINKCCHKRVLNYCTCSILNKRRSVWIESRVVKCRGWEIRSYRDRFYWVLFFSSFFIGRAERSWLITTAVNPINWTSSSAGTSFRFWLHSGFPIILISRQEIWLGTVDISYVPRAQCVAYFCPANDTELQKID